MGALQIRPAQDSLSAAAQDATLLLASSNALSLADSGAPAAEVAKALTEAERAALPVALRAARADLATLEQRPADEEARLIAALTSASIRMQPHLDEAKREDWIHVLMEDLAPMPLRLVLDGCDRAKVVCKGPWEFLPAVVEYVEPRAAKIRRRVELYGEIARAAR